MPTSWHYNCVVCWLCERAFTVPFPHEIKKASWVYKFSTSFSQLQLSPMTILIVFNPASNVSNFVLKITITSKIWRRASLRWTTTKAKAFMNQNLIRIFLRMPLLMAKKASVGVEGCRRFSWVLLDFRKTQKRGSWSFLKVHRPFLETCSPRQGDASQDSTGSATHIRRCWVAIGRFRASSRAESFVVAFAKHALVEAHLQIAP